MLRSAIVLNVLCVIFHEPKIIITATKIQTTEKNPNTRSSSLFKELVCNTPMHQIGKTQAIINHLVMV